jgi:hypothetical protein
MPAQRSPAIVLAVGALALLAVVLLFQLLLEAPPSVSCSTSLGPGAFSTLLVPAHLAAAAVLWGCLFRLGANRGALAAAAAYALACLVVPGLFVLVAWPAVALAPLIGLVAVAALLRAALDARHARGALWIGLLFALPANLGYAWLSGASPFCF